MLLEALVDHLSLLLGQGQLVGGRLERVPDVLNEPYTLGNAEALDGVHVDLDHERNVVVARAPFKAISAARMAGRMCEWASRFQFAWLDRGRARATLAVPVGRAPIASNLPGRRLVELPGIDDALLAKFDAERVRESRPSRSSPACTRWRAALRSA